MKTNLTHPRLFFILLTIGLLCSSPFIVYSQQNSVQELAKKDAERDANNDMSQLRIVTLGFSSCVTSVLGAYIGLRVGQTLPQTGQSDFYGPSDQEFWGCCIGGSVCFLLPYIYVYTNVQDPPPERFLGRSPEYIKFYTIAYKKSVQEKWLKSTISGLGFFF
ncbi:hypothetical protein JT359_17655 [Candidatus Poribacteria bacterium]|nr:hypothetical protein [Candidatus Poribacteria bacterium]